MGMSDGIEQGCEYEAELGCGWYIYSTGTEHMTGTDYAKLMIVFNFISLEILGGSVS